MMEFVSLMVAAAVGGLAATALQVFYTAKAQDKRNAFAERKEAYIGFWKAIAEQEVDSFPDRSEFTIGHWLLRCQLVASGEVFTQLDEWMDATPGSDQRIAATKSLKAAMRNDLGISRHNL